MINRYNNNKLNNIYKMFFNDMTVISNRMNNDMTVISNKIQNNDIISDYSDTMNLREFFNNYNSMLTELYQNNEYEIIDNQNNIIDQNITYQDTTDNITDQDYIMKEIQNDIITQDIIINQDSHIITNHYNNFPIKSIFFFYLTKDSIVSSFKLLSNYISLNSKHDELVIHIFIYCCIYNDKIELDRYKIIIYDYYSYVDLFISILYNFYDIYMIYQIIFNGTSLSSWFFEFETSDKIILEIKEEKRKHFKHIEDIIKFIYSD